MRLASSHRCTQSFSHLECSYRAHSFAKGQVGIQYLGYEVWPGFCAMIPSWYGTRGGPRPPKDGIFAFGSGVTSHREASSHTHSPWALQRLCMVALDVPRRAVPPEGSAVTSMGSTARRPMHRQRPPFEWGWHSARGCKCRHQ
jgi:hypothetical protein